MRKTLIVLTLAAAAAVVAPVDANAADSFHGHHHHWSQNCNNDPDSEFAMDPDVCPPSKNADAYYYPTYGHRGDY